MKRKIALIVCVSAALFSTGTMPGRSPDGGYTVRGVSVYGLGDEEAFPMIVRDTLQTKSGVRVSSGYITIQFDVLADNPPPLKIRFLHCTRDWVPEDNLLIQDDMYNTSFHLEYTPAPNAVRHYAYRYANRFPDSKGVVKFNHSGNWLFRIMDGGETIADGRFIVVDNSTPTRVTVTNAYMTEKASPFNEIQKVDVTVELPDEIEGYNFTVVDVYQNRRLHHPARIDAHDRDSYTVVEGYNSGTRTFTISSIQPGNEYRVLNLGNANRFPNREIVRTPDGVDLPRMYWQGEADHNGVARLNRFTGINSDYLEVMFRLDPANLREALTTGDRGVYLAGSFNNWNPSQDDSLTYDPAQQIYTTRRLLRRGIYDYQYVTGDRDDAGWDVAGQDWLELEGNDWRTTNTYTAIVYYRDIRFGGFDRITGFGVANSDAAIPGSR